jgi:preprotein translocase subunit SecG
VKQLLLWLIIVVVFLIGFLLYRSQSGNDLNVTPEAQREIDKAERR